MYFLSKIKKFFAGYFNILIIALLLLFIFRPYDRLGFYNAAWQFCFVIVLLSSIFNCHHPRTVKIITFFIGIPALILHWASLVQPTGPIVLACLSFTIIFITICTASIIFRVVVRAKVTLETLKGAICAYFLVGFVFALAFFLIEVIIPGSFYITYTGETQFSYSHYLSEMIYFSFVTLLTIGYGDINAIKDVGQTLVILEGVIGKFYVAILVARLVAVYSLLENKNLLARTKKEKSD